MIRLGTLLTGDGATLPIAEREGRVWPLSALLSRTVKGLTALMGDWDTSLNTMEAVMATLPGRPLSPDDRFASPIAAPGKVLCIGVNYRDHIAEMGAKAPDYPYAFLRPATCLTGHLATVTLPDWPEMIDWEAELGVVIGTAARNLTPQTALSAVAGYTVVNDVSARDWIESAPFVGIDWVMQKGWDGFQPTGPWLVPARYIPDPQALHMELTVNGVVKQSQTTAQMLFGVVDILCHLSRIMTLQPGDIIATGTPSGVGFGRRPREFLHHGDEVSVRIDGLGTLTNRFISARKDT
jgi:2-keto-4-pentenoate hydratase/2-oxohepta-3-ene-1,7-dioic acid hydratase in catechol pathway